jgi:hypothetical protein
VNAVSVLAFGRNRTGSEYLRVDVGEPFLPARVKERTVLQFAATVSQLNRHVREYIALPRFVGSLSFGDWLSVE